MRLQCYVAILLLGLSACSREKNEPKKATLGMIQETPIQTYRAVTILAAGQSNMAGYGMKDHPFPSSDRVTVVGNAPLIGEYGPAYAYAMQLIRQQNVKVLVIQCAVGGSSIDSWQPWTTNFQRCTDAWRQQGSPRVDVVLWMQGEAEAMTNSPQEWSRKFEYTVASLRSIIGNSPVVYAQIGPNPASPNTDDYRAWQSIQEQQAALTITSTWMVTTEDLTLSDDWVHFDAGSYETIGKRMFYTYSPKD